MMIKILGDPVIQERHRKGRHGYFYDPTAAPKKALGLAMLAERVLQKRGLYEGPIALQMTFCCKGKRGDLDNMIKALLDAGNGVLWKDDRQVLRIVAMVVRDYETPSTQLSIETLIGGDHGL